MSLRPGDHGVSATQMMIITTKFMHYLMCVCAYMNVYVQNTKFKAEIKDYSIETLQCSVYYRCI